MEENNLLNKKEKKMKDFKKLIIFFLFFAGTLYGSCNDDSNQTGLTGVIRALTPDRTPVSSRAFNNIVSYYEKIISNCSYYTLSEKLNGIQNNLNAQINANFNGRAQIPYNGRNSYNGQEVEYTEDDGTKRKSNTAVDGTDHIGLIKYIYDIAGVNTIGFNELDGDDLAKMTQFQLHQNSALKVGDIIVMNYDNDHNIDTYGVVYKDISGRLKMLEMGGSPNNPNASSVKSEIPITSATSTAYVVPFESLMEAAYYPEEDDPLIGQNIKENLMVGGKNLTLLPNNPNVVEVSTPRAAGPLQNNGFSEVAITVNDLDPDPENQLKQMTGATKVMFENFSKGQTTFSLYLLTVMVAFFTFNILWKILRGGIIGEPAEIFHMILSEFINKSPYFIFVVIYPLVMRNIIMPLFLFRLPTFLFGDFIKVANISMENGEYVTYLDLMAHIMKKGWKLVVATFGVGLTQQPQTVKSLFGMFGRIWKTLSPANFTDWVSLATAVFQAYGTVTKIVQMILQMFLFRPLSATVGLMTVITLFNIALNLFMSSLTFVISTSVGMFYLVCGTIDILRGKALNTFSIILSGIMQYLVLFAFVILMSETVKILGDKMIGVILNPANFFTLLKIYLMVSIVNAMCKQISIQLSTAF